MIEVVTHEDPESLAFEVAGRLLETIVEQQSRGVVPDIGLTGGSIADAVHRAIPVHPAGERVDWERVVFWWGDERFVPRSSMERNAGQARRAFLDLLDIPPTRIHEIGASDEYATAEAAAAAYSDTIKQHGSGAFAVLMLGMGPDGHVASLFPQHPALDCTDLIACAVHDSPKPPPSRVTLTLEALNHAEQVWFLVAGTEKAPALAAALAEETDPRTIPARGVRGHDRTVWLIDKAAAQHLPQ